MKERRAYDRHQKQEHSHTPPGLLVVSGFFKEGADTTAADKMMRVLKAESMAGNKADYIA